MTKKAKAKSLGEFIILMDFNLGKGSYGKVYKGFRRADKKTVAIKVLNRKNIANDRNAEKLLKSVQGEVDTLMKMQHPNIIRLYDFKVSKSSFYLIMEYCDGGDLSDYLKQKGPLNENTARRFLQHLALGLQALRREKIVHRDLKPHNLLLSEQSDNAILKIADFGFARQVDEVDLAATVCGSPLYMAPEVMQRNKYDASADLWSVGTILFEMIMGRPLYRAGSVEDFKELIKKPITFPEAGVHCSEECLDLLKKLLQGNPNNRISFEDFFNHPFLQEARSTNIDDNEFPNLIQPSKQERISTSNVDINVGNENAMSKPKMVSVSPFIMEELPSLPEATNQPDMNEPKFADFQNPTDAYDLISNESPAVNNFSPPKYEDLPKSRCIILDKYLREVRLEDLIRPNETITHFPEVIFDFSIADSVTGYTEDISHLEDRARRAWVMAEAAFLFHTQQKITKAFIVYTKALELLYNTLLRIRESPHLSCERLDLLQIWIKYRFSNLVQIAEEVRMSIPASQWEKEVDSCEKYIYDYVVQLGEATATSEYLGDTKSLFLGYNRCKILLEYLFIDRADKFDQHDLIELQKMHKRISKHCTYLSRLSDK